MYLLLLQSVSKVFHERFFFRYNRLYTSMFTRNKNKFVTWIINSSSEQLLSKHQIIRNFQTEWITYFSMFKYEQAYKFSNFDRIRLYAHKYKMELHSSSAVISNMDKAQESAHEDKLKTTLKRLIIHRLLTNLASVVQLIVQIPEAV